MSKIIDLLKQGNISVVHMAKDEHIKKNISKDESIKTLKKFRELINVPIETMNIPLTEKEEYEKAAKEITKEIDETIKFIQEN